MRAAPDRTALLFDFDGTLSPIVDRPADARPGPGVVDALVVLTARYRTVTVISGRPVAFLADHLPPGIDLSGLYGLERRVDGVVGAMAGTDRWRGVIADAVSRLEGDLPTGVFVEPKGLSVTVHTRLRPDLADAAAKVVHEVGAALDLDVRPAKSSLELHPPVAVDKGTVVRELAAGADAVLYAGDDVGDTPAFRALHELRAGGVETLAVLVESSGTPVELHALVDVRVGPGDVLDLLTVLASPPSS